MSVKPAAFTQALLAAGLAVYMASTMGDPPPMPLPRDEPTGRKSTWAFPAPLAGTPPLETWLPHELSAEEAAHRAEVDRGLMDSHVINSNEIFNAGTLQDELKAGQYDQIEAQLDVVLAKFRADPVYELALSEAAGFADQGHAHGTVADMALIQAWVTARPKSAWAHYSAGLRWSNKAWEDRGDGWASTVTDAQFQKMHADEVAGRAEIQAALKIDPKLSPAWETLMEIDRSDPGASLEKVTADFNLASKQVPTSYAISEQYEITLEPRWLGSAGMMDDFAQSQLANLDRNPRFWGLQGDALADSGCAACNDYRWDVSLKQYNAALAFKDKPEWLEAAGKAALHLHRYALAHAYYEREMAYVNELYTSMYRDFTEQLCDPTKTPQEVEQYRQDVVKYGGLDNVQYPHGPDDCVVYQRELPWGAEPLPDASGVQVLAIDPVGHPIFVKEPKAVTLYDNKNFVTSVLLPNYKQTVILVANGDGKTHHLELHDQGTGKTTILYASEQPINLGYTSDGKNLFVSDWTRGAQSGCRYFSLKDPSRHVEFRSKVIQWLADQHQPIQEGSLAVMCSYFTNDDVLNVLYDARDPAGKPISHRFSYGVSSDVFMAVQ